MLEKKVYNNQTANALITASKSVRSAFVGSKISFIDDFYVVVLLFVSNDRRVLKPFLDKFTPLLPFVPKIAI